MDPGGLLLGVLGAWRVTHLLNAEDGPAGLLARLRRAAGQGFWGELLDCFYCLSLWVAIPLAWVLGQGWRERLLLWPALSAGAVLLERATRRDGDPLAPPAVFHEEDRWPVAAPVEPSPAPPAARGLTR